MAPLMTLAHVSFGYTRAKPILQDLTFQVSPGEIVGFLGANGAGKTTTFHLLNGHLRPDAGTIEVDGASPSKQTRQVRRILGFVPDEPLLTPTLSAAENLNFFGLLWGVPRDRLRERAEALLRELGLWDDRHEWIRSYSRGMAQKVAFCAALLHEPKVLVLDEPFTGLDIQAMAWAREHLRRFADQGGAVLFSSHIPELLDTTIDRLLVLDGGKLVYDAPRERVAAAGGATRVYTQSVAAPVSAVRA